MTRDPTAQLAPADLENTEWTLEGRIDLCTFPSPHDLFTDIINPESRDGDGQQAMIEAFGIREFSCFQIKTAGLIIAETLLNGLITNDKFCFTRDVRLKLTWWRRALKQRSAASFSATILTGCGGSDEAPMDEVPRSA